MKITYGMVIFALLLPGIIFIIRNRFRYKEEIRIRTLLLEITAVFIAAGSRNMEEKLCEMLGKIGEFFKAESVRLQLLDKEYDMLPDALLWLGQKSTKIPENDDVKGDKSKYLCLMADIKVQEKIIASLFLENCCAGRNSRRVCTALLDTISQFTGRILKKMNEEEKVYFMAYYDQLTKLPNRVLFHEKAEQAVQMAKQTGKMVVFLFLDLDSFKNVNDTLGHESGDELLRKIAGRLSRGVERFYTVARFGGDEYLIMLNHISDMREVIKAADALMKLFDEPFILKEQKFNITASAGISFFPGDGDNIKALLKKADMAMYAAKLKGKNQYVIASEMDHQRNNNYFN